MSRYQDAITELLYNLTLDGWAEPNMGSTDELGWYGMIKGAIPGETIDRHNDLVSDPDLQREQQDYRERPLKAGDIYDLMTMVGVIVEQDNDGFVASSLYDTSDELSAAWADIEDRYHVERCEECEAEAEEYGRGMPVEHETGCSFVETAT